MPPRDKLSLAVTQLRPSGVFQYILSSIIASIVVAGIAGGYFLGERAAFRTLQDLISNPGVLVTMDKALGTEIENPLRAEAWAKIYGTPPGDRAALLSRLSQIVSTPPYQLAPFVGHRARPTNRGGLYINSYGFRDERENYADKPAETVRAFITGGSTAFGVGATVQKMTIAYQLEEMLNRRPPTAHANYQIVNATFPAWSTTQEKLFLQQYLIDLKPDLVVMFSGNNDVHWKLMRADIRHFYSGPDRNYVQILDLVAAKAGYSELAVGSQFARSDISCAELGVLAARNVEEMAFSLRRIGASLVFALQPNIVSTSKSRTPHENFILQSQIKPEWDACYESIRSHLARVPAKNYAFVDLSKSFGDVPDSTELFLDAYHFSDFGNREIAKLLMEKIDWRLLQTGSATARSSTIPR
jgi:lysophospholipase L1-like esterase